MSSSVGCESMLKWVCVSVEGETRVGVGNSLICVKLHVSNVKKELCQSPPPPPTDIPRTSANGSIKYIHPCTGADTPSHLQK